MPSLRTGRCPGEPRRSARDGDHPLTPSGACVIIRTVSGKTNIDRRTVRRQATRQEILDASWAVVRKQGLAGLSMRDLGERVGMRAQSIYSYFASKHEIYDAMFLEGYQP